METTPSPEVEPSIAEKFNTSFEALQQIADQEDDGRMRVSSRVSNPNLPEGLKIIHLRAPDSGHRLGITLQEADENMPARKITVDVISKGEDQDNDLLNLEFTPDSDPIGNEHVAVTVIAPPVTVLTEADHGFLNRTGLHGALDQAYIALQNSGGDYQVAAYLASNNEVAALGNLPQAVVGS